MTKETEKTEYGIPADFQVVDLTGLPVLGEGSNAIVYALGSDRIVKVMKEEKPAEELRKEMELMQNAYRHGIACPRCYGLARAGEKLALIIERASVTSYLKLIKEEPSNVERYMDRYVELIRKLHSISGEALKDFPRCSVPEELKEKADRLDEILRPECRGKLRRILESAREPEVLTHGDIQPKNIRFDEKGAMFIDMETLSTGPFFLDFGALRRTMFCDWEYGEHNRNSFLDLSVEESLHFWNVFTERYFDGWDQTRKENALRYAETVCHILAVTKMRKRGVPGGVLENGIRKLEEMTR